MYTCAEQSSHPSSVSQATNQVYSCVFTVFLVHILYSLMTSPYSLMSIQISPPWNTYSYFTSVFEYGAYLKLEQCEHFIIFSVHINTNTLR